ncbi:uncharacterized protein AMSG_02148 [Thecamonas trahens ATCC 50062]|uniref:Ras-GAP domain-containing protein n=1 Tax=Thecamonas trahens ATCC 50062 TaxID=461836 RepID=A0A0L0DX84_THETB|nr:hypothetical protein AMSG_02148 [Thecamonas trahens ATCC 50062]KNC56133.1 hypothetical protein AMSG_02148 [Thecamonas trahens ATCC 50062]|eukprot:XP_013761172.1 hypothetical protein AMSG_02148 [Thecamonas trahens ATCC 50062]
MAELANKEQSHGDYRVVRAMMYDQPTDRFFFCGNKVLWSVPRATWPFDEQAEADGGLSASGVVAFRAWDSSSVGVARRSDGDLIVGVRASPRSTVTIPFPPASGTWTASPAEGTVVQSYGTSLHVMFHDADYDVTYLCEASTSAPLLIHDGIRNEAFDLPQLSPSGCEEKTLVATATDTHVWIGWKQARIAILERANPRNGAFHTVGCCDYVALAYSEVRRKMFAATDQDFILALDETSIPPTVVGLGIAKGTIRAMWYDADGDALFVVTSSPNALVRFDPEDLSVYDTLELTSNKVSSTRDYALVPNTNEVFVVTASDPAVLSRIQHHDCGSYTSCASCAVDGYCAWCATTMTCTEKRDSVCVPPTVCPAVTAIAPTAVVADTAASGELTITGVGFVDVLPAVSARFDTGYGTASTTFVSETELRALIPTGPAGTANMSLEHLGASYAPESYSLEYVSCGSSNSSCHACVATGGGVCSWCPSYGGFCSPSSTIASLCEAASFVVSETCPALSRVAPSKGPPDGGNSVILTGQGFVDPSIAGTSYTCVFNKTVAVGASWNPTSSSVSCVAPSAVGGSSGDVSLELVLGTLPPLPIDGAFTPFIGSSDPLASYRYVTCGESSSSCADCAFGSNSCFWCESDSTCRDVGTEGGCAVGDTFHNCPAVTSIAPSAQEISSAELLVTLTGTGFDAGMACLYNTSADDAEAGMEVPTTFLSGSPPSLVCTFPPAELPMALTVGVRRSGSAKRLSAPEKKFEAYECAPAGSSCSECLAYVPNVPNASPCGFCVSAGRCLPASGCASYSPFVTTAGQCPRMASVSPLSVGAPGGTMLTLTLDPLRAGAVSGGAASSGVLECVFTAAGTPIVVPATTDGSHVVRCAIPAASQGAASRQAAVAAAGTDGLATVADSTLSVMYYACVGSVCSACTAGGADCGWCLSSSECTTAGACSGGLPVFASSDASCPALTGGAGSPTSGSLAGGTRVVLAGGTFVAGTDYAISHPLADATGVCVRLSSSALECTMPAGREAGGGPMTVAKGGRNYASGSSFTYYDCGMPRTCAECTVSLLAECGWCASSGVCTTASAGCGESETPLAACPVAGVVTPSPSSSNTGGIVAAVVLVVVVVVAGVLTGLWLYMRSKAEAGVQPLKLTAKLRRAVVYGTLGSRSAPPLSRVKRDALEKAMVSWPPDFALALALADVVGTADADLAARSLVHIYEAAGQSLAFLTAQVQAEVACALSLNTLFRTNSLATKAFKVFSKIHGIDYLSATLGMVVAEAVSKYGRVEVDAKRVSVAGPDDGEVDLLDSNVDVNRFKLLTLCQSAWVRIQMSMENVPPSFRELFAVVMSATSAKFPISLASLASSVHETIGAAAASLATSQDEAARLLNALGATRVSEAERNQLLAAWSENLDTIASDYELVTRFVEDQVAVQNPGSPQAGRVLARLQSDLRSVTVGGFFFLRFLVPALTAPHAYGLLEGPPNKSAQRVLILLAKVIQNLSNGKEFGSKEPFMAKMNEFVVSNHDAMSQFLDSLTSGPASSGADEALADGLDVPPEFVETAYASVAKLILAQEEAFSVAYLARTQELNGESHLTELLSALAADDAPDEVASRIRTYSSRLFDSMSLDDDVASASSADAAPGGIALPTLS